MPIIDSLGYSRWEKNFGSEIVEWIVKTTDKIENCIKAAHNQQRVMKTNEE